MRNARLSGILVLAAIATHADATVCRAAAMMTSFEIDSSGVQQRPAANLPPVPLLSEAFEEETIVGDLLQIANAFQLKEIVAGRDFLESPAWFLEVDPSQGSIVALRKPVTVRSAPQNDNTLAGRTQARLVQWGIPPEEMLRVLPRRLKRQDENNGVHTAVAIHRYKTFVIRGINGVPIEGHRAVVTYHLDGSFHRVLIKWPWLATAGHRLRTNLTNEQIEQRAIAALQAAGESAGEVTLKWKYLPTGLENGQVTLELVVGARVAGGQPSPDLSSEAREINVPIDAY